MSSNSDLSPMHSATHIVNELNQGHEAKSTSAREQAGSELRESFNQLLGPSVSHATREQVLKDVFKIDPQAEAKIHQLLPNVQIVHDKNGIDIDKTVRQLEKQSANPIPAPDEQVNTPSHSIKNTSPDVTYEPYERLRSQPIVPAPDGQVNTNSMSPDAAFEPYERLRSQNTVPAPHEHVNINSMSPGATSEPYERLRSQPTVPATDEHVKTRSDWIKNTSPDVTFEPYEHLNSEVAPNGRADYDLNMLRKYLGSKGLSSGQIDKMLTPGGESVAVVPANQKGSSKPVDLDDLLDLLPPRSESETYYELEDGEYKQL
jgi:hypothetical protein